MVGQGAAALPPLTATGLTQRRVSLLGFGVGFDHRLLEVLERQRQLVGVELLRTPAELHPLQLADEVAQAFVLILQAATQGALGRELGAHRQHGFVQLGRIVGKARGSRHRRRF